MFVVLRLVSNGQAPGDRQERWVVEFVTEPRSEPYGRIAVFVDVAGNRWDLLGPDPR